MMRKRVVEAKSIEATAEEESGKRLHRFEAVERCNLPLFVLSETLICASQRECVSCAHKIVFGVELPPGARPNVRPEMCPRAKSGLESTSPFIGLYPIGSRVLTVGDGDLSFSLSLVRRFGAKNVTATTFESRESIIRSYPETGLRNLKELRKLGCVPQHGVDAMDLAGTLDREEEAPLYDFIVFNFPCIATDVEGEDGQNQAMLENQDLLRLFGQGASTLLHPVTGQLHVTHKTKAAFKHWDVSAFVVKSAEGLRPLNVTVFDRCAYPGYINRKARDRKSFPATDAVVFIFGFQELGNIGGTEHFKTGEETIAMYVERVMPRHILPCTHGLLEEVIRTVLL